MELTEQQFEDLVAEALDSLPEDLGRAMDNVAIVVEDWPSVEQLGGRSGTLLGLYQGIALTSRSPLSYNEAMPDRITIFQGPLTQLSHSEEQLKDMVRTTVVHEIAHHFGMSDARLKELGWA